MYRLTAPFLVAALTGALALPLAAETKPKAGSHDARVTYATYVEGQVYAITTRLRTVTLVEVGAGEKIQSVAIGDLESFKIDRLEAANLFIIKPVIAGASTNITVETNQHIYFLSVTESSKAATNFSVKFTVPGSSAGGNQAEKFVAPAAPQMAYTILKHGKRPEFTPVSVSDDGRKTYFTIPAGAPIPTIFRADDAGKEYSVNAAVKGTTITVSTRSARWVLRYDDKYVCIQGKE